MAAKVKRHVVIDVEAIPDPAIPPKVAPLDAEGLCLDCRQVIVAGKNHAPQCPRAREFPPPVAWQIVSLGCFSFADFEPEMFGCVRGDDERAKVASYAAYLERDHPCVVGWNTRHFDTPVIGHRALKYGIPMPWWYGTAKNGPRYRYGDAALDLKDALADHGAALTGSMVQTARLIGWPGKGEIDGSDVERLHGEGKSAEIDRYCMTDVAQEAAIWLRFELLRGSIKPREWGRIATRLLSFLEKQHATAQLVAAVDRSLFIGPEATQTSFAE